MSNIDEVPSPGRFAVLAVQHVITMYAGSITVPLAVAGALKLAAPETAFLISSGLIAGGIVTLIQCLGVGRTGLRMPVMMGVTFVGIGPTIAIALNPSLGLPAVFGASMAAGLICFLLMPWISRLTTVLTPAVTGTAVLLIGLSLVGVALDWAAGGSGAAHYGSPENWAIAGATLLIIVLLKRFSHGFIGNAAVLLGVVFGSLIASSSIGVDFKPVIAAPWLRGVAPFHFGFPRFDLAAILSMTVALLITLVESSGMLLMLGRIVDRPLDRDALGQGLKADALGACVGGLFNSFPCTSYSQNIALVGVTGNRSRFVCAGAGVLLIALAFFPKLSALVAVVPSPVLGGAALVLFGMVAAAGISSLSEVDFLGSPHNGLIVGVSLGFGMAPTLLPNLFKLMPAGPALIFNNGMLLGVFAAVTLSLLFGKQAPKARSSAETLQESPVALGVHSEDPIMSGPG